MNVTKELRNATTRYIEAELRAFPDIERKITALRSELMNPWKPSDENFGGGKSNVNVSQTEVKATRLATDERLARLQDTQNKITRVYNRQPDLSKQFIEEFYFKNPRKFTMTGIADKLNVGERTVYRLKKKVLEDVAEEFGLEV